MGMTQSGFTEFCKCSTLPKRKKDPFLPAIPTQRDNYLKSLASFRNGFKPSFFPDSPSFLCCFISSVCPTARETLCAVEGLRERTLKPFAGLPANVDATVYERYDVDYFTEHL